MSLLNSSSAITLVTGLAATLLVNWCKKISVKPESTQNELNRFFKIYTVIVTIYGAFNVGTDKIFSLFQTVWPWIAVFSGVLAVLPPAAAYFERAKDPSAAEKEYALKNLGFNLSGFACVLCILLILTHEVADFRFLQSLPVFAIISLLIPLCLWVVLSYQSTEQQEQKNDNLDHDASLGRVNQCLNILHLFNVFFCSLSSAVLLVAYTLYCRLYHVEIVLNFWYLAALSILLVFFYFCGRHKLLHVRMVCMSNVPVILITSVYWMSWFTVNDKMLLYQSVFIIFHSLIYVTFIYQNMGFYQKDDETEEQLGIRRGLLTAIQHPERTAKTIWQRTKQYYFYGITLVIVTAVYAVFLLVPLFFAQESVLSFNLSEKIIAAVCEDTDYDVDAIFEEMKENEWANQETETIDRVRFADFVYRTLRPELLNKKIIAPNDQSLSYDRLKTWFES